MYPGETLRLYVDANRWSGEGNSSSSSEHVTLGKHGYDNKRKAYYTDITAVSETERPVTVTYRYSINKKQTFKISVNDRRREATAYFYALNQMEMQVHWGLLIGYTLELERLMFQI